MFDIVMSYQSSLKHKAEEHSKSVQSLHYSTSEFQASLHETVIEQYQTQWPTRALLSENVTVMRFSKLWNS